MTESWLSALKSPELIFAVMLTAKTCLVAGAGFLVLAPRSLGSSPGEKALACGH